MVYTVKMQAEQNMAPQENQDQKTRSEQIYEKLTPPKITTNLNYESSRSANLLRKFTLSLLLSFHFKFNFTFTLLH